MKRLTLSGRPPAVAFVLVQLGGLAYALVDDRQITIYSAPDVARRSSSTSGGGRLPLRQNA